MGCKRTRFCAFEILICDTVRVDDTPFPLTTLFKKDCISGGNFDQFSLPQALCRSPFETTKAIAIIAIICRCYRELHSRNFTRTSHRFKLVHGVPCSLQFCCCKVSSMKRPVYKYFWEERNSLPFLHSFGCYNGTKLRIKWDGIGGNGSIDHHFDFFL